MMSKHCEHTLCDMVLSIISASGFDEEAYIFIDHNDEIYVDFDKKEAALYLIKIADEPTWKDCLAASYTRVGKRHRVLFILW